MHPHPFREDCDELHANSPPRRQANLAPLALILADIIANRRLTPHFQPIVDLAAGKIIGYEALIRGPSDTPLHSPGLLFQTAMQVHRLVELEILCRDINIEFFSRLNLPGKLFLNISPKSLLEENFPKGFTRNALQRYGLEASRVVIELTENFPILDVTTIHHALQHYRDSGFQVALDDLGAAYAGLRLWTELKPDFVKFDKYFIQAINQDKHKKQLIQSLQDIAEHVGCQTIAEGIETIEEYYTVQSLGVCFGQGYYFSRPTPTPPLDIPQQICLHVACTSRDQGQDFKWRSETVANLIKTVPTIGSQTTLSEAGDLLEKVPELMAIPVVDEGFAGGMLHRHHAMNVLASRFGRDLHGRRPIREFIDRNCLRIETDIPIEQLSQIITNENNLHQGNHFIITEKNRYRGIGQVTDLLKRITELQIRNARYANPLTLLPGNVPIHESIERLVANATSFTACYVDLDHFKPFNDTYGYSRGDMVIRLVGRILQDCSHPQQDFVGHIGGDDFMVLFRSEDWQQRCQNILQRFADQVMEFYNEEHRQAQGIAGQDRQGQPVFYGICSLSIGATCFDGLQDCCSHHDIATLASEAKKQAKKIQGNSLFINRRRCWQLDTAGTATDDGA